MEIFSLKLFHRHCLYYISSIDKILNTNINAYLQNKYNKRLNTLFVKTIEIVTMFNKFWHLQYNSPNSHLSWKYKIMLRKSVVLVLMHQFLRCVIVWTLACRKKCFILIFILSILLWRIIFILNRIYKGIANGDVIRFLP